MAVVTTGNKFLNALNLNKSHWLSHKKGGSLNLNSSYSEYNKLCHPVFKLIGSGTRDNLPTELP